jgi:hypothetical protein
MAKLYDKVTVFPPVFPKKFKKVPQVEAQIPWGHKVF